MANANLNLTIDLAAFQKSLTAAFSMYQTTLKAMGQESPKAMSNLTAQLDDLVDKASTPLVLQANSEPFTASVSEAKGKLEDLDNRSEQSRGALSSWWDSHKQTLSQFSLVYRGVMDVYNDVTRVFGGMIDQELEAQKGMARVEAAVRSTGGAAGYGADQLKDMAGALEDAFAIDADDLMNKVTTPLLTFTQISGEVFDTAQEAIIDISRALGTDLQSSAMQVGKALNDPIRGVAALREVGVSFSADQEQVIRKLVETGQVAEAQKIILQELATEFGGQAAAYMETGAGKLEALKVALDNLSESMGSLLLPILNSLGTILKPIVEWLTNMDTAFKILIPTLVLATAGWYKYAAAQTTAATVSGALTAAITTTTVAVKGFLSAIGPVGWALMGVTAAVTAWTVIAGKAGNQNSEFKDSQSSLKDELKAANAEVSTQVGRFQMLSDKLLELRGQSNLTTEQNREMELTITQLNQDYGDYIGNIDLATAAQSDLEIAINRTSEALINQAVAEAYGSRYKERIDAVAALTVAYNDSLKAYRAHARELQEQTVLASGPGAARQANVQANPLLLQVEAASQELERAKGELEEFRKAYYSAVEDFSASLTPKSKQEEEPPGEPNNQGTSQTQDAERVIADLARLRQSETQQLEAEYQRRLEVIRGFLVDGSEAEKAAIADLDAWKTAREQEITARETAGIQAKFQAEVNHLANLQELGVSGYDQLKAKMDEYYQWAKTNLPKEEAALVQKQVAEVNLRWGKHIKDKQDKELAHQRSLQDIRREFNVHGISEEDQTLVDKLVALDRYYQDNKALMLEAGLTEEEILRAQAEAEEKITEESEARKRQIREQNASMALSKTSNTLGRLADMQDKESRRGFATWKAMSIAQAYVDMSAGILGAFRSQISIPILGPILAAAEAAVAAAFGIKQIEKIEATKFEPAKAELGGYLDGASHDNGGILIEAEGGEYITRKSRVQQLGKGVFDFINNGPINQVKELFSSLALPAMNMDSDPSSAFQPLSGFVYAAGGQVVAPTSPELGFRSGRTGVLLEQMNEKLGRLLDKNVHFEIHVDPLSNDPVKVSEIAQQGTITRSPF